MNSSVLRMAVVGLLMATPIVASSLESEAFTQYFSRVPNPPASLAEARQRCGKLENGNYVEAPDKNIQSLLKDIETMQAASRKTQTSSPNAMMDAMKDRGASAVMDELQQAPTKAWPDLYQRRQKEVEDPMTRLQDTVRPLAGQSLKKVEACPQVKGAGYEGGSGSDPKCVNAVRDKEKQDCGNATMAMLATINQSWDSLKKFLLTDAIKLDQIADKGYAATKNEFIRTMADNARVMGWDQIQKLAADSDRICHEAVRANPVP